MESTVMLNGIDPLVASYSKPDEARKIFEQGILSNPLISKDLPTGTSDFADKISFTGAKFPSIPINWRFAESAAAIAALEAALVAQLVKRKYGVDVPGATINTDHASLFLMSPLLNLTTSRKDGKTYHVSANLDAFIPNYDFHQLSSSTFRGCATNIYRTKDDRFFHLHGSMNPNPTLDSIGLPHDSPTATHEEACQPFIEKLSQITGDDMQIKANDEYKQAGVICETTVSYRQSAQGKANAHVGLFEIYDCPNPSQPPGWWPESPQTSPSRPLAGLKVVDLTRVIAAPAVTRGLAELGASVMRVTSPNICDYSALHIDLNWGKWNSSIDLTTAEGRRRLTALVLDADVVVQGYRPGVLDKHGFGQDAILALCARRARGVISVRENCYGWHGPFASRSGWQQISDASAGVSWAFGRAMGLADDEPVTPVFPNSDFQTGLAGVCAVLVALIRRAEHGGSHKIDVALNYYSRWLVDCVGEYPGPVWEDVWTRNGKQVFRCWHNMSYTLPRFMAMLAKSSTPVLFRPEFFEERVSGAIDAKIKRVKPVIAFGDGVVELGFNVGTRGNGVDQPWWPEDLMVEVVT